MMQYRDFWLKNKSFCSKSIKNLLLPLAIFGLSFIALNSVLHTFNVAFSIAILLTCASIIRTQQVINQKKKKLEGIWPEIIELLISGVESGLTLSESIASLSNRGPVISRKIFSEIAVDLKGNKSLDSALTQLKNRFLSPLCDQLCEVIHFSQRSGSRDTSLTLRTLATFISDELLLREEINAKQSWIKNSALLASISPWILLALLSTQSASRSAYSSATGFLILFLALFMTSIAYLWMERVSRVPDVPRAFTI